MQVTEATYPQLTEDEDERRFGRAPAPGQLSLVHDFVRTGWWLDRPENLLEWLRGQKLVEPREVISSQDLGPLIELRGALREVLASHHDNVTPPEEAIAAINKLASAVPLRFGLTGDDEAVLAPVDREPVRRVIGKMLGIVYDAMADGTWKRLKICRAGDCQWAFYDSSRNRSGAWCSMSGCGNRAKARAFRQRRSL